MLHIIASYQSCSQVYYFLPDKSKYTAAIMFSGWSLSFSDPIYVTFVSLIAPKF